LGGFTLTTTIIYLSLHLHTTNRVQQAALLHQQSLILNSIVEPQQPLPPPTAREVRAGVLETVKDGWNRELERNVRKVESVDWNGVRDQMEDTVSRLWRRAFAGAREAAEEVRATGQLETAKQREG